MNDGELSLFSAVEIVGRFSRLAGFQCDVPAATQGMLCEFVVSMAESDSPWIGDANPPVMAPAPLLLSQTFRL